MLVFVGATEVDACMLVFVLGDVDNGALEKELVELALRFVEGFVDCMDDVTMVS